MELTSAATAGLRAKKPSQRVLKQRRFAAALGLLLTEGLAELRRTYPSAHFRMGEGYVGDTGRRAMNRLKVTFKEATAHRPDGGHWKRLAQDLVLDIDDSVVESSEHPAWAILDEFWRRQDMDARTGIEFEDANHFSFVDGGII
jgi:hypothetical protein